MVFVSGNMGRDYWKEDKIINIVIVLLFVLFYIFTCICNEKKRKCIKHIQVGNMRTPDILYMEFLRVTSGGKLMDVCYWRNQLQQNT